MDSRKKCDALKSVRKVLADKLGIDLHQKECTYEGECVGTCPKCKQEEEILNSALLSNSLKKEESKINEVCSNEVIDKTENECVRSEFLAGKVIDSDLSKYIFKYGKEKDRFEDIITGDIEDTSPYDFSDSIADGFTGGIEDTSAYAFSDGIVDAITGDMEDTSPYDFSEDLEDIFT